MSARGMLRARGAKRAALVGLAAAPLAAVGMAVAACGGLTEPAASAVEAGVADADTSGRDAARRDAEARDATPVTCVLDGDRCVGSPACCEPLSARLVDLDAGCTHPNRPFECFAPVEDCVIAGQTSQGCYVRQTDGGREVFATYHTYSNVSTVEPCDERLTDYVLSIQYNDCP